MARSAATIQAEIDALRASLSTGILRVRHGDTDLTYQSAADMKGVLDLLLAELNRAQTYPIKQVRFVTSKGLD